MKNDAKREGAVASAKGYAENLYDRLEAALDGVEGIGRLAVASRMHDDLRQLLGDTVAVANAALGKLEIISEDHREDLDLESDEAYHIVRRFCYARLNNVFSVDEFRFHLGANGVKVTEISDDDLLEYLDLLFGELQKDLREMYGLNTTRCEYGTDTAIAEVTSPEAAAKLVSIPNNYGQNNTPKDEPDNIEQQTVQDDNVENAETIVDVPRKREKVNLAQQINDLINAGTIGAILKDEIVENITLAYGFSDDTIKAGISQLVSMGIVYSYREQGKTWITFNQEMALAKQAEYKLKRRSGGRLPDQKEGQSFDMHAAERILLVFIGPNTHVQSMMTVKEIWSAMQGNIADDRAFTDVAAAEVRQAARYLVGMGLMTAESRRSKRGPLSRSAGFQVLKFGLISQDVKESLRKGIQQNGSLQPMLNITVSGLSSSSAV